MKILLSPLFYQQRFCRHCVRIVYRNNPDHWIWQFELERMPPLGRFVPGIGFVPDLPVLLMFDEFLLDGEAGERIMRQSGPGWLGSWPDVLQMLDAEGTVSRLDLDAEVKQVASVRAAMLRQDMRDPGRWADSMTFCDALMGAADRAFTEGGFDEASLDWEYDSKNVPGVKGPDGQYHMLSGGPLVDLGEEPDDPHYALREQARDHLRRQLREVNAGLAVATRLGVPLMFWAPYKEYLKEKTSTNDLVRKGNEQAEAAQVFFKTAFPRYSPNTIEDLKRLRQDRRIRQLRETIAAAAESGDLVDPQYPQRVLEEVLSVERRAGKVRQITGWVSNALGVVPVPGLGVVAAAAGEAVSRVVEARLRKKWNWFYLISNGIGRS